MRIPISVFAVLGCAFLCANASAAEKPLTVQQARVLFEKEDRLLNEAWMAVKKALSESGFNELKEEQRAWVEYRDYLARSPLFNGVDAQGELSRDSAEYLEAAAHLAESRTRWLKGLTEESLIETLTGVWIDSYGGRIEIVEKDGQLHFVMECVRGPTSHVGELSGIAAWNRPIGWFSDKDSDDKGEREANLSFILQNGRLQITGANTGHYHGARAYFDGGYVRTESLNAQQQTEILQGSQ